MSACGAPVRFVKMHGLGNDFVVLNSVAGPLPGDLATLAVRMCDRHRGIGADGILVVARATAWDAHVRMIVRNADGSEPEMCGNGIRCFAKYVRERRLVREAPMRVQTGRGVLSVSCGVGDGGMVESATVSLGAPGIGASARVTDLGELPGVPGWRDRAGVEEDFQRVSMGNPHAVFFCRDADAVPLAAVGPLIERHALFPDRTNVHFAQIVSPTEVRVRTFERGVGITHACGTGAAAVGVAAALAQRAGRRIRVRLPGGDLEVDWREDDGEVWTTGPAIEVFSGEWPAEG